MSSNFNAIDSLKGSDVPSKVVTFTSTRDHAKLGSSALNDLTSRVQTHRHTQMHTETLHFTQRTTVRNRQKPAVGRRSPDARRPHAVHVLSPYVLHSAVDLLSVSSHNTNNEFNSISEMTYTVSSGTLNSSIPYINLASTSSAFSR